MTRLSTVPDLEDENLRSDFRALGLLVFCWSDRAEIPQHLQPQKSTEGGELQESEEEVRLGYVSGPASAPPPPEDSQIDVDSVADQQFLQKEARVTASCDCGNTWQRKGCLCRSAGEFRKSSIIDVKVSVMIKFIV